MQGGQLWRAGRPRRWEHRRDEPGKGTRWSCRWIRTWHTAGGLEQAGLKGQLVDTCNHTIFAGILVRCESFFDRHGVAPFWPLRRISISRSNCVFVSIVCPESIGRSLRAMALIVAFILSAGFFSYFGCVSV